MKTTATSKLLQVVPSLTQEGKTYEIKESATGSIWCSCPAWRFQRLSPEHNTRVCKHLKAFFARQLSSRQELTIISKGKAAYLLATAKQKEEARKEAERLFQASKKAQQEFPV